MKTIFFHWCLPVFVAIQATTAILVQQPAADQAPITKQKETEGNATFYYELRTENEPSSSSGNQHSDQKKPSLGGSSSRAGRMLDLDALVGDFAAAQANRARSQSGNRQSRYLPEATMEVVGAKKLHIQGFIPIVGLKDADLISSQDGTDEATDAGQALRQRQQSQQASDLPYAQSSIGHASYAPLRHSSGESEGGTKLMMDSLKRPIRRLSALVGGDSTSPSAKPSNQNCLCVPFYMCKDGYINEPFSSSKSQIQQQQAHVVPKQMDQSLIEIKSDQLMVGPQRVESHSFDSYAPIDERSLDQNIVTASSLLDFSDILNEQQNGADAKGSSQDQQTSKEGDSSNSTDTSEYTQEILGRMLGIKIAPKASSSSGQPNGSCGILRTCCNTLASLHPSQQDSLGERLVGSQYGLSLLSSKNRPQPSFSSLKGHTDLVASAQQQQQYQISSSQASLQQQLNQKLPYGFPQQMTRMLPLNTFTSGDTALSHRSNQMQQNRYQQPQINQYSRVQSFPQPLINSIQPSQLQQQLRTTGFQIRGQSNLGTRKILEGRCGLRQSEGINGRVQNLQYHESSSDFGEYPAQGAILKRLAKSDSLFICGAALISQYWIATAAHCIKKHSQSELKVRLGEWDVHRDDEFYPFVEKDIRDIVIHPEFVAGNLVNDIALLRLDSPVDPSLPHVNPACLPALGEQFNRQNCWVTGWGKDSFGQKGSFQAVLREVELPVIGHQECESALRQTRLGNHYRLHQGFICAGGEGGRDACEGDGGSGLFCTQEGVTKLAGLVSWGIGCGQAGVPGVYVNIAHYRPWIESIISVDEDIYSPYMNLVGSSLISERSNANETSSTMISTPPTVELANETISTSSPS